jgi:hypothetical protein
LRSAEFGFLGVVVVTFVHTPRLKGDRTLVRARVFGLKTFPKAGVFDFCFLDFLGFRTS